MSGPVIVSEKELLLRVAENDEPAFRQLFNRYHQQLGAHLVRVTESPEMAEEIVLDVFLKIWMNREILSGVLDFRAYLFIVSRNHALNCLKKKARELALRREFEKELSGAPDDNPAQEAAYYTLLDNAIDQLPPQQQKVYLLSRHQRLKYSEIAAELHLSRETVKKYLQFAMAFIRSHVQKHLYFLCLLLLLP